MLLARVTYADGFKVGKMAATQQQSPQNGDEIKNRTIGNYVVGKCFQNYLYCFSLTLKK
jgi:hypothetical protein